MPYMDPMGYMSQSFPECLPLGDLGGGGQNSRMYILTVVESDPMMIQMCVAPANMLETCGKGGSQPTESFSQAQRIYEPNVSHWERGFNVSGPGARMIDQIEGVIFACCISIRTVWFHAEIIRMIWIFACNYQVFSVSQGSPRLSKQLFRNACELRHSSCNHWAFWVESTEQGSSVLPLIHHDSFWDVTKAPGYLSCSE